MAGLTARFIARLSAAQSDNDDVGLDGIGLDDVGRDDIGRGKRRAAPASLSLLSRAMLIVAITASSAMVATGACAQSFDRSLDRSFGNAGGPQSLHWSDEQDAVLPRIGAPDGGALRMPADSMLPERLRRAVVAFPTREPPGTIVIDTGKTQLYYVLGNRQAIRYGIGVGREGFTWSGVERIVRKVEWPDWIPPAEMIARQPYLPRFMAGGPGNPLGAAALYLGASLYRIHGTNDPSTIGKFVSSGCIRLTNEDIRDLFARVRLGARVVVLPKKDSLQFEAKSTSPEKNPATITLHPGRAVLHVSQLR